MTKPTLVTALFDLARREASSRPTPADYLERGSFVLGLDADLVIFADRDLAPMLRQARRLRGLSQRTKVIAIDFEELPTAPLVPRLEAALVQHPILNADPGKDTPRYIALGWAKFSLLQQVVDTNPFGASHLGWIDLGLPHVALTEHCLEDGVFDHPPDAIRVLMLRPIFAEETSDPSRYFAHVWGHIAAGYATGALANMQELCELFEAEALARLHQGYAPLDEHLLAGLTLRHPHLFEFHYGDYDHILENYVRLRGSAANLVHQMRICRGQGAWPRACDIGSRVLASRREGSFTASSAHLSALLDEYFIAAFYLAQHESHAPREIAEGYAELVRTEPAFRDEFLRNEIHIRSNFSHLGEPISL